jgi:hypothetical protein
MNNHLWIVSFKEITPRILVFLEKEMNLETYLDDKKGVVLIVLK